MRLSVAVLAKSRPKVERVDVGSGLALVALLRLGLGLTRSGHAVEAVKGLRGDHGRLDVLRLRHGRGHGYGALVARDHAVEAVRLGIAGRLAQGSAGSARLRLMDAAAASIDIVLLVALR